MTNIEQVNNFIKESKAPLSIKEIAFRFNFSVHYVHDIIGKLESRHAIYCEKVQGVLRISTKRRTRFNRANKLYRLAIWGEQLRMRVG